jgi:hypothetical protein
MDMQIGLAEFSPGIIFARLFQGLQCCLLVDVKFNLRPFESGQKCFRCLQFTWILCRRIKLANADIE